MLSAVLFVCGVGSIAVSVFVYQFQPTNTDLLWRVIFGIMHVTIYAVTSTNETTTCAGNEIGITPHQVCRWALAIGNYKVEI